MITLTVFGNKYYNFKKIAGMKNIFYALILLLRKFWRREKSTSFQSIIFVFKASFYWFFRVIIPAYDENVHYPLPRIVFRLFTEADCSDVSSPLPKATSIERFLVEEDLNWIISNNYLNRQVCARELLGYIRGESIPLEHCIVEVIFSQLFRLPDAPYLELFYSALFIELCRKSPHRFTDVLTQATHILYKRTSHMQLTCVERFVRWFSYHLSNFHFRWMWDEWSDCIDLDEFNSTKVFVREVLERCVRLSYYKKVVEMVPEEFAPLLPREPVFFFVVDDGKVAVCSLLIVIFYFSKPSCS